MASVGTEILNEIERVSAKRERWKRYASESGSSASFGPAIALMTMSITAAKEAIGSGDVLAVIRAYEDLQGFDSDD